MKGTFSFIQRGEWLTVTLAVVISVLGVVSLVQASSTISTNISTEGALTVTGISTLTGAVYATSTVQATGALTTFGNATLGDDVSDSVTATAYFTQLRIGTGSTFGHIGTVGADELGVEGDIEIDGTAYFDGIASTTALRVGDDSNVTTINGMVFGYCTLASVTVVATSTAQTHCTGATGVLTGDRVWVMATSSLPTGLVVDAASTTASDIIGVRINNATAGANTATGAVSLNFWAVRP